MREGIAVVLALVAYTMLSTGLVLMKKGIAWTGTWRPSDRAWRRAFTVWTAGFVVSNLYVVPSALALKIMNPHTVAAIAGWGVVVLIILSRAFLREKVYRTDIIWAAVIVAAIVLLSVPGRSAAAGLPRASALIAGATLPLLLIPAAFARTFSRRVRATIFAVVSGLSSGLIVVLLKILIDEFGYRIGSYFGSVWFYAYLFFSLAAFLSLQMAYRLEALMRTAPVQYSLAIAYPAVVFVLVYGNRLSPVEIPAVSAIVLAVVGILRKR